MQLSNGIANPASLWFGHLMFDGMFGVVVSIVVVVAFSKVSTQFSYLPLFVSSLAFNPPNYESLTHTSPVVRHATIRLHLNSLCILRFATISIRIGSLLLGCGLPSHHVHVRQIDEIWMCATSDASFSRLYLSAYLLTLTYAKTSQTAMTMNIIRQFAISPTW